MKRYIMTLLLGAVATPVAAFAVTPIDARATTSFGNGVTVDKLVDGSGLSDPNGTPHIVFDDLHDNNFSALTMWHAGCEEGNIYGGMHPNCLDNSMTIPRVADQKIEFLLDGNYDLSGTYIWQMNQGVASSREFAAERGVSEMDIWTSLTDDPSDYQFLQTVQLSAALGTAKEPAQYVPFDVSTTAKRLRFDVRSAHSGNEFEFVGLSEVRFDGTIVPEPANLMLVAIGLSAMLWRKMREGDGRSGRQLAVPHRTE